MILDVACIPTPLSFIQHLEDPGITVKNVIVLYAIYVTSTQL